MEVNRKKYFHSKLLAIRNAYEIQIKALDALIEELGYQETENPAPKQGKRRNLAIVRMEEFEEAYTLGTWRKPQQLRKSK